LDNTTVLLSLNLQDDHALYAYWKSNSSTIPNENASSCDDLNLTDDDSDCWQLLSDNDSILNPVWTDNSSQHTGIKTFTVSGIQHTLPTDNFTNSVSIYARDHAGNIALIGGESFAVDFSPISITTSDNFSGSKKSISILDNNTSEDGDNVTLLIRIAHIQPPEEKVQVDFTLSDETEASFNQNSSELRAQLYFDNDTWNTAQVLNIYGVDDDIDDGDKPFNLTWKIKRGDNLTWFFQDQDSNRQSSFVNKDNDNSSFELSVIDNTSSESGGTAEVSLKLSSAPFDTGTDSIESASGDIATVRINVQIDNISEARINSLNGTRSKTLVFDSTN